MNTEQLYAFKAAFEQRSFTKAAELQIKSQSAVTQLIRSLERELNQELFARHTRPVRPTEAGERFYPYAVRMLGIYEESLAACASQSQGLFCLHYMATFVSRMDRFLASLKPETVPETVKIDIEDFIRTDGWQPGNLYLVREEILLSKNIVRRPAYESVVYAEVSARSELAGRKEITLEDLTKVPVILPPAEKSTSLTRYLRKLFSDHGGIEVKAIDGVENGLMYAMVNDGVCFCTDEFLRPREHVRSIPFPEAGVSRYSFAALSRFTPEMTRFMNQFDSWQGSIE